MLRSTGVAAAAALRNVGNRVATPAGSVMATRLFSGRPEPCQAPDMLQIGTRRIFDSDHDIFRENARRFFNERVVPFHAQWEEDGHVSRELWQEAGENGLLAVMMPEEYGGSGGGVLEAAIVWEEQSYTGCTGPGFALHSEIVAPYVLNYGTEEQKQEFLPKLISGEWIGAIAMTEPGAGSDLQGVKTTAKKDGDDYILNGSKTFITNGYLADVVVIVAKTDPSKGAKGTSLFLVNVNDVKGFSKGQPLKKMGMKAQDTCELFFDDMRVPKSCLLGQENLGFKYLMDELPQERLLIGAMGQAAAEASFEWTRNYVKDRKAFGGKLSDLQTIRHTLAQMKIELASNRAFVDTCLELHANKRLDAATASAVKSISTDLQMTIADRGVQLHGGWGYMREVNICRAFVDGRVQRVYGGANEIMKELVSRTL